jgi:hypothetical protein
MALATEFSSRKQWDVAVKPETTTGTANVTTMQELNVDDWTVNSEAERFLGIRQGEGRTIKLADNYVESKGKVKGINMSGLYDTTMGTIFLENVMNIVTGASPASVDIPYNFTGTVATWGEAAISDNIHTLTMAVCHPQGSNSVVLPGCVCNRFKLMANAGEDGGRFHFEADMLSQGEWSLEQAAPGSRAAYPAVTTHRTLYDLRGASAVYQLGGVDVSIYKIEIEIIANVQFVGVGTNGVYDQAYRASPNFDVNILIGVKIDSNSDGLYAKQFNENTIVAAFHNNVWASATFGFLANFCQISGDFQETDVEGGAFYDVPLTCMASTSGDVIQIVP